jgi:hypothetical protein
VPPRVPSTACKGQFAQRGCLACSKGSVRRLSWPERSTPFFFPSTVPVSESLPGAPAEPTHFVQTCPRRRNLPHPNPFGRDGLCCVGLTDRTRRMRPHRRSGRDSAVPLSLTEVTVPAWITALIYCAFLTPERAPPQTYNRQLTSDTTTSGRRTGTSSLRQPHMDPNSHAWMLAGACAVTGTIRARSARAMQSTAEP